MSILFCNDFSFTASDCKVTRPKVYHSNCAVIIYQRWPFSVNLKITLLFLVRCQFENFQSYGPVRGAYKIDVAVSKMKGSFCMIGVVIIWHPNRGLTVLSLCSLPSLYKIYNFLGKHFQSRNKNLKAGRLQLALQTTPGFHCIQCKIMGGWNYLASSGLLDKITSVHSMNSIQVYPYTCMISLLI